MFNIDLSSCLSLRLTLTLTFSGKLEFHDVHSLLTHLFKFKLSFKSFYLCSFILHQAYIHTSLFLIIQVLERLILA